MGGKNYESEFGSFALNGFKVVPVEFLKNPEIYMRGIITLEISNSLEKRYLLVQIENGDLSGKCVEDDLKNILVGWQDYKIEQMKNAMKQIWQ